MSLGILLEIKQSHCQLLANSSLNSPRICVCRWFTTKSKGCELKRRLFLTCCNPSTLDCECRHKCNYFCHNNCSGRSCDKPLVLRKDVMLATCWHLQVAAAAMCSIWGALHNYPRVLFCFWQKCSDIVRSHFVLLCFCQYCATFKRLFCGCAPPIHLADWTTYSQRLEFTVACFPFHFQHELRVPFSSSWRWFTTLQG